MFRSSVTTNYPLLGLVLLAIGFGSTNVIFGGPVAGSTGVPDNEQGVAGALVNAARTAASCWRTPRFARRCWTSALPATRGSSPAGKAGPPCAWTDIS